MFKKISVIGLGYIGLPTAAMFASRKVNVLGVDIDQNAVDTINNGDIHIVEPDLDIVVHAAVKEGYLKASTQTEEADAFLIAVPTPFKANYEPDLNYIHAAAKAIAPVLKKGDLLILESTSPVGATEQLAAWIAELRTDLKVPLAATDDADIFVAHCPERVLPGHVMRELISNDRIIGGMTPECAQKATDLYRIFVKGDCITTNCRTAEMAKLTENSFRDVNIAFANELSLICDELDISVWELIALANRHPRVNILQPGPGVGGHCIAVDPWFIVSKTPELARIIRTAREVNDGKPEWVLNKLNQALVDRANEKGVAPSELTVACLGLAFKPDIDDLRESPALNITLSVCEKHQGKLLVVEPNIDELPKSFASYKHAELTEQSQAIADADVVLLLVDHKEFKQQALNELTGKALVDTRGLWS